MRSLIACSLKIQKNISLTCSDIKLAFRCTMSRPSHFANFVDSKLFLVSKLWHFKKLKKLLTNSICPSLQLEWRNRPYTEIAFELYKKCKKRIFLSNQQASTACVWIRCYSYIKCNKTSQHLLLDCCCVYHQIKSYCQTW